MQQVFDSSKADIPSWMVRSTINYLGYYFFLFWFWFELSQRQNNLWSTVNLLGDSYEEVANLLDVPGQSAGSEHPGLWRCQEAFYQSLIFTKNHVRMKWTWKCLTFPPKRKLCQLKETTTKNITRCFELERAGSPLGAGTDDMSSSVIQVSDRWPRIITCWESYLKSNGFHQKRIQRWGGHGKDGLGGKFQWVLEMNKSNWYCSFHYV